MNDIDQAPAADPALDAVEWLSEVAETTSAFGVLRRSVLDKTATIRDALADRITADEARTLLGLIEVPVKEWHDHKEAALIARLGKIAEAGR